MVTNVFFSVIVPCYNQAQYLSECLQSVLDQSFQEWECIIVDDGSPDNTEAVAQEWCGKDLRFRYLKKTNGGLADARNAGIAVANGEWILPLDSDDKISSDFLREAKILLDQDSSVKLLYSQVYLFGDDNRKWGIQEYEYDKLLWFNMLVCTCFYKKKDFNEIGGYNKQMVLGWEDWDLWLRLLKKTDVVKKLPSAIFYYRVKNVSMIKDLNSDREKKRKMYWQIFENHKDLYMQHESYISCMLEKKNMENAYDNVLNSKDYKLGYLILRPFRFLKKLFSSK